MAFGKTTKKKQNAFGKTVAPETALPVTGSKARSKQPGKSAAAVGSAGDSSRSKGVRAVQMTSIAASLHNPAGDQSIIALVRTMAAGSGAHSVEAAQPLAINTAPILEAAISPALESHSTARTSSDRPTQEEISHRAYFYWAERGFQHGYAHEDWVRAEADLTR